MALEKIDFNIASFNDTDAGGNNYYVGEIYEAFNVNGTLANIFSDAAGSSAIVQDGIANISNSEGECAFYIDRGDYYLLVAGKRRDFTSGLVESELINNLSLTHVFDTVAAMTASTIVFLVGKKLEVKDIIAEYVVTSGAATNAGSHNLTTGLYAQLQEQGERNPLHYGVTNDAVDTTAALQAFRNVMAADTSKEAVFPEGIYSYSTSPNWAIQDLVVRAKGKVTFRNTGTGHCLILLNNTGTTFNIYWCWDNPMFIEGDDNTGHGLLNRSVHHSKIAVNVRGCGQNVQRSEFAVLNEFNIVSSINQGPFYSATAPSGIHLSSYTDITKETSACIWYNPIIEGMRGSGIYLDRAINNKFILGTSEANVGAGVSCSENTRNNSFEGIDLEVSGSGQGFIDRGRWNKWENVFNDSNSTITSTAVGCTIQGGILSAVINEGAYTNLLNINYGADGGEVTDTGTFTTIVDAYDLESASIKISNKTQGKTQFTTTETVGAFAVTPLVPGNITKVGIPVVGVKVGDLVTVTSATQQPATFSSPTARCNIDGQIEITFSQLNGAAVSPLPTGGVFVISVSGG